MKDANALAREAGFNSFGDWLASVRAANTSSTARQMVIQASGGTPTNVTRDDGFFVPPDYRSEIVRRLETDSLLGLVDRIPVNSSSVLFPADSQAPWATGEGQFKVAWTDGVNSAAEALLEVEGVYLKLKTLTGMVKATDEMVEDAAGLGAFVDYKAPQVMGFELDRQIIAGTGVGRPLGITNAPATIEVAKESGQAAKTVVANNVAKMWARMPGANRRRAVWIANETVDAQLANVSYSEGAGYKPSDPRFDGMPSLYGRPVYVTQAAEPLGSKGDLILADMTQYAMPIRAPGIRRDVSIHCHFDYGISAFRFNFRVAGQPWWSEPVDPRDSDGDTLSPFVVLGVRA